ncbi:MAG: CCA tRNA nucleotidyltransferase [Candidatus Micrarchaeaceae archaeon]
MGKETYGISSSGRKRLGELLKEVIEDVKPSKSEIDAAKYAINTIMGRLKIKSPKDVEILLAGSVARGTQIKGNSDIDIFLLFPRNIKESDIERKGLEIGKGIVKKGGNESYIVKYAEHPYTRIRWKDYGISIDIVPAYKIETAKERGTAVDRTQLHNEFVNSKLTVRQRDDVRILKAFLKAHSIYGAEAKIEGFSGYLCELLVCHYGSFLDVITGMANIRLPVVVDVVKPKGGEKDNAAAVKRFGKNFVVIDPTDSDRNVAANVSDESLFRLVLISRELLKSHDKKSFYAKGHAEVNSESMLNVIKDMLQSNLYALHFNVPEIAEDIIWQQLKKARIRLQQSLGENGFQPIICMQNVDGNDAVMGFFIENVHAATRKVVGPSLMMGNAVDKFMKAHSGAMLMYIDCDRICAIEKARYSNPEKLIRAFLASRNSLPSNLKANKASMYVNKLPERHAKLLYLAYVTRFQIY